MNARYSGNINISGLHSSTFTRLRDSSNSRLSDTSSFSSSTNIPKYSTQTLNTKKNYSSFLHDGPHSSTLNSKYRNEELGKATKQDFKMEEQILDTIKSAPNNFLKSQEFNVTPSGNIVRKENGSLHFPSLSRFKSSVGNTSKILHDNEITEMGSMKLVPIGIYDLEPFMQSFPDSSNNTTPRISKSKSLTGIKREEVTSPYLQDTNQNVFPCKEQPLFNNGDTPMHELQLQSNDSDKSWYKPNFSRDYAVSHLMDKPRGTFLVRKSSTHIGSYVLVLKTDELPINGFQNEKQALLPIRHFLIDPTMNGLRFKGYINEPEFANLEALVEYYKRNITILPCRLADNSNDEFHMQYMTSVFTEVDSCLDAMKRSFDICYANRNRIRNLQIRAKLNSNGVYFFWTGKLTHLKSFYKFDEIDLCCIDPFVRKLTAPHDGEQITTMCGFLTRSLVQKGDGCVHIFTMQNLNEITNFINFIMSSKESKLISFN